MVLAGHGRLAAGKLLAIAEVPVIVARGWSDRQKRAYVIVDNRLTDASDWDDEMLRLELNDLLEGGFELSLTGITESELSRLSVGVSELGIATAPNKRLAASCDRLLGIIDRLM